MHASRSPHAGFPNCHTPPGPRHPLWHSSDRGERPTAGAFPPLVIESWRWQNRCGEMGSDERDVPGRRLVAGRRREVVSAQDGAAATRPIHGCLSDSASLNEPFAGGKPGRCPNRTGECMGCVIHGGSRRWRPALASVAIIGGKRWSPTPPLAVSRSFESRSSGWVRQRSSLSPSSQSARPAATTPPSQWLQRLPRFHLDRQARQQVAARRMAAARPRAAARQMAAARRALP